MTRCDEPLLDKSGSDGLPEATWGCLIFQIKHCRQIKATYCQQKAVQRRDGRAGAPDHMTYRTMLARLALLPALAAAACAGKQVRVGTFGDSNPEALVVMSDWLNSNKVGTECWTF